MLVNGVEYDPGKLVHTLTTNAGGFAATVNDLLPYSTYEIVEKKSPDGYLNTGETRRTFEIRADGVIVQLRSSETAIKNDVIRGGLLIEKWDNETGEHAPQGSATFEGAVFEIVNHSRDSVIVQDTLYGVGEVVFTLTTNESGAYTTPADLLPYGSYEVREISPPEGYLATGVLSRAFEIREHGAIVELNTADTAIRNNPMRGDFRGVKISDGDTKRMAGVAFRITSATTGESHTLVTDKNGEINTSSDWNPHSQNANRGETDRDGIWFGKPDTLNDDLGALLYDTYIIEEMPCDVNKDKELLTFEMSIYRHMSVVNLGTMTNDYIQVPEISTTALDAETSQGNGHVSEKTTIVDTVYYSGLKPGQEYTLKGALMERESGKPLLAQGKEIASEKAFKATGAAGSVSMEFSFNSLALQGKSVVVFETLFLADKEVAAHADIAAEEQTIAFTAPSIRTSAATPDGKKTADIRAKASIVDTVAYVGLLAGETYTLRGVLIDKATGKPLLANGEEITASATFKAQAASGTASVTFEFSAVELSGKTAVVFETLLYKERELAVHADMDDAAQTVKFAKLEIGTSAAGSDGSKVIPLTERAVIVDKVSYSGLTAGETYILQGILMDKAANAPLLVDGREVRATKKFTAEAASGTVDVEFSFNSLLVKSAEVVVFESLQYSGKEIAAHADINDKNQAVTFAVPKLGTNAKGKDGSKTIPLSESAVVIDDVSYSNLTAGESYVLKGVLMDKATGKPLLVSGKEVRAETAFTPAIASATTATQGTTTASIATAASGTVEVTFTLNATELQGKTAVVFETLEQNGKAIAVHADISDASQTVTFPEPPKPKIRTSAKGKDGSKIIPLTENAVIIDVVSYSNLKDGESYVLKGVLMDKSTGKPLVVNGKEVRAETAFKPKLAPGATATSGTVEVTFNLNSLDLQGKTAVVFETLEQNGKEIAAHADISDASQTVTFPAAQEPKIATSASAENGGKSLPLAESATVIDTVAFSNLTIGEKYVLKGILMDKSTGEPLLVGGSEVTAETTFTTKVASGSVKVVFTFDTSALAGKTLVVFETLECDGRVIATHTDLSDEAQTVFIPKSGEGAKTGRDGLPVWLLFVGFSAAGGFVLLMLYKRRLENSLLEDENDSETDYLSEDAENAENTEKAEEE